jgi:hypothetical protein
MTDESGPPWVRAGGYPQAEWLKVLRLATKRYVDSANALGTYFGRDSWDLGDFCRLRDAADSAHRDWRAVVAGAAEVVGRLSGEIMKREEQERGA